MKNEVSIRHIFFRTLRFCHMSRSLLVFWLVCQDTLFFSLIYFFDQMLVCSFWGGGSGLDFFGLVLLTSTATLQRSPEGNHGHVPWPMNGVHFATENRTGFQKKDQGEDGDSRRESYLFPKIFVTNLQIDQVRFSFNVTEVSIFLLFRRHTSVNQERTQMVWREDWKHPTRRHSRNGSST